MDWVILPLRLGELQGLGRQHLLGVHGQGIVPSRIPIYSYLLTSADRQRKVLFDLGPPGPELAHQAGRKTLVADSYRRIDQALGEAGVLPDEVEAVVLSHLHWDHMEGLEYFHHAKVYLQADEWSCAQDESNPQRWFFPQTLPAVPPQQLVLLKGRQKIAPGLEIVPLPGHTPGSQGLVVQTAAGPYVCCGDLIYRLESLDRGPEGELSPPGLCCNESWWRQSAGFLRLLGNPLPAHDERIETTLRALHSLDAAVCEKFKETT